MKVLLFKEGASSMHNYVGGFGADSKQYQLVFCLEIVHAIQYITSNFEDILEE